MNRQDLAMKIYVHGGYNAADSFARADRFIAECELQKSEPKAIDPSKCHDGWHSPVCPSCKSDNEASEPKACEEPKPHDKWHCGDIYCPQCNKLLVKPEPPKPERVAKRLQVGSLVRVFDRYRLAVPCIGTIIKTEGVVQGCLVQLENGSHGRAEERYPDGIHVCFEQLREILPGDEK